MKQYFYKKYFSLSTSPKTQATTPLKNKVNFCNIAFISKYFLSIFVLNSKHFFITFVLKQKQYYG